MLNTCHVSLLAAFGQHSNVAAESGLTAYLYTTTRSPIHLLPGFAADGSNKSDFDRLPDNRSYGHALAQDREDDDGIGQREHKVSR